MVESQVVAFEAEPAKDRRHSQRLPIRQMAGAVAHGRQYDSRGMGE